MTIGRKCLATTLITSALTLAVAVSGYWGLESTVGRSQQILQGDARLAENAALARISVLNLRRYEKDLFLNCLDPKESEEYRDKFLRAQDSLEDRLARLDELTRQRPRERQLVARMHDELRSYLKGMTALIPKVLSREIRSPQDGNRAIMDYKDEIHRLEMTAEALAGAANERMRVAEGELNDGAATTRVLLGISAAAALVLGITLSHFLGRGITRSTRLLLNRVQEMAGGASDLTSRVVIQSHDEVGELAGGINAIIAKIQAMVQRVRETSVALLSMAAQLGASAKQQETTVQNLGSSTTEIVAAVREISATGKHLAGAMGEVNERANQAAGLAVRGRSRLSTMETDLNQLVAATNSISDKLAAVREKAEKINLVVTTITRVSEQTNLLSINAAIEAEKAGEYGRGFLVVAREIRRLADQTAVATLDIENIVRLMQAAVSAGVMQMDRFSSDVRAGVESVVEINGQTSQIIEEAQALSDRFRAVDEGVRQQALGAQQISEAMGPVAAGARQTQTALQEFHTTTVHLRHQAEMLNQEVAQFTV
jgi:methyl-accepting chemotaxis protein WspA